MNCPPSPLPLTPLKGGHFTTASNIPVVDCPRPFLIFCYLRSVRHTFFNWKRVRGILPQFHSALWWIAPSPLPSWIEVWVRRREGGGGGHLTTLSHRPVVDCPPLLSQNIMLSRYLLREIYFGTGKVGEGGISPLSTALECPVVNGPLPAPI